MGINVSELHQALADAGIPIESVDSRGKIDFAASATDQQIAAAKLIVQNWNQVARDAAQAAKDAVKSKALADFQTAYTAYQALVNPNAKDVQTLVESMAKAVSQLVNGG